jgi:hypothetical protein
MWVGRGRHGSGRTLPQNAWCFGGWANSHRRMTTQSWGSPELFVRRATSWVLGEYELLSEIAAEAWGLFTRHGKKRSTAWLR